MAGASSHRVVVVEAGVGELGKGGVIYLSGPAAGCCNLDVLCIYYIYIIYYILAATTTLSWLFLKLTEMEFEGRA